MKSRPRPIALHRSLLCSLGAIVPVAVAALLLFAPTEAHAYQDCELSGCGTNTPIIYASPIEALSVGGDLNRRGIKLLPIVERVEPPIVATGACPDGGTIGVEQGELVCRHSGSTYRGAGLVGIAFTLSIPETPCSTTINPPLNPPLPPCTGTTPRMLIKIKIAEVGSVKTWEVDSPTNVVTYRMVWHQLEGSQYLEKDLVVGESICPMQRAWMDPWQNPDKAFPWPTHGAPAPRPTAAVRAGWTDQTDHLLIVHGETYFHDATVDVDAVDAGAHRWFNIGCVGTAVAKMRLLGSSPIAQPAGSAYRASTLKMLTARYRGSRSYTSAGMPLYYQRVDNEAFYGQPDEPPYGQLESYWVWNGASCVSHRRTWQPQSTGRTPNPLAILSQWMSAARPEGDIDGVFEVVPPNPDIYALYRSAEEKSLLEEMRPMGVPTCSSAPVIQWYWRTWPASHVDHSP